MISSEKVRKFVSFWHESEKSSLIIAAQNFGYEIIIQRDWPINNKSRWFSQQTYVSENLLSKEIPEIFIPEDAQTIAAGLESSFNYAKEIIEASLGSPSSTNTQNGLWEDIEPFFHQDIIWEGNLNKFYLRKSVSGLESMASIWLEIKKEI